MYMASGRKKEKEYGSWIQIKIKIKLNDEKFFDSCWMERKVLRKKTKIIMSERKTFKLISRKLLI